MSDLYYENAVQAIAGILGGQRIFEQIVETASNLESYE